MAAKIRKGDRVIVISGRDKGKVGEVLGVQPDEGRAVVRGVNLGKRHQRQTASQQGGIISREMPIHLSNLAFFETKEAKATRVGFKFIGEGADRKKVRVSKRTGETLDG